ncbi:right-handed parallel beta-helix repeat-containing protein [Rhodohalobacter sp. SW132]|uniref:right-handed parallel beta-helix repeat-containing protein n=1 Tax=Rhodohalobacter sp. SW132 TaxID=2293433 RepID=UPI000E2403DD|nr:right-handed parallel beta-helix repeat-containing protein [Rhodohalobacter sp. SW132]REL33488.1 right-handed parallel beta-helix repeat-containing protein [Rhodohalobacter sp. SW132]
MSYQSDFIGAKKIDNSRLWLSNSGLFTIFIIAFGLLLVSCDDDDPTGPDLDPDPDPEVEASFTITPESPVMGDEVTLDAGESEITDGEAEFSWTLNTPAGSEAELDSESGEVTGFTADAAGDYNVDLVVTANGVSDGAAEVIEVTAEEEISSNITDDRTLHSEVTYFVTDEIDITAELTIEPGTEIYFESGTGFELPEMNGAIIANGTEEEPILFSGTSEQPGWWNGIYVRESSNALNQLNWVTIEYGGGEEFFRSGSGNVIVGRSDDSSSIEITNSTIRHSESYGIWVNSDSDLPEFEGNTITENEGAPVSLPASSIHQLDAASTFAGNNDDYVFVRSGNDLDSDDVTWENLDADYRIRGDDSIEITNGVTLTIEPGATLKFESAGYIDLDEQGGLMADGTEAEPILFTGTTEQAGWWDGIYVRESNNTQNVLDWVTVEYGGGEEFFRSGSGNVIVGRSDEFSSIEITNSTIRHSASDGIWVNSESDLTVFEGNTITENESAPVNMPASSIHQLDATSGFTGNADDFIFVRSGHEINNEDVTWENLDVNYRIGGGDSVEITDGVTLTIEPGATLEFENSGYIDLDEQGGLMADGTEAEPILFTGTTEQAGWWDGIYVRESTNPQNLLDWVTVEYGGGDDFLRSGSGNVVVGRSNNDSSIDITNSVLQNSATYGLWVESDGTVNDDACDVNTFENNSQDDCLINE